MIGSVTRDDGACWSGINGKVCAWIDGGPAKWHP